MAGGAVPKFFRNVNGVNAVSAGRCGLRMVFLHNDDASPRFLQLFNSAAASVTLGTTVPDLVIQIGADNALPYDMGDVVFQTALSFAITTTAEGSTNGTANHVMFVIV